MRLGRETVTRVRAGTKSSGYGTSTEPDWDNTLPDVDVPGCDVQPVTGAEINVDRDGVRFDNLALLPYTDDALSVAATDRIRWRGDLYDITGPPQVWHQRNGHVEIQLVRSTG